MYNYLLCILFGIILFILLNSNDGFSIGIPEYELEVDSKNNFKILSTTDSRVWTEEGDDIFVGLSISNTMQNIDNYYYIWSNEGDDYVYYYLRDLLLENIKGPNTLPKVTKRQLEELLIYTFGEPLLVYREFKVYSVQVSKDLSGIENEDDPDVISFNASSQLADNLFEAAGDDKPSFANIKDNNNDPNDHLFYLTKLNINGNDEDIVSRVYITGNDMDEFTALPRGRGYGEILLFLLAVIKKTNIVYNDLIIDEFIADGDGGQRLKEVYKDLFYKSTTLWPKLLGYNEIRFTLFRPVNPESNLVVPYYTPRLPLGSSYDDYMKVFKQFRNKVFDIDSIDKKNDENKYKWVLFIWSLDPENRNKFIQYRDEDIKYFSALFMDFTKDNRCGAIYRVIYHM